MTELIQQYSGIIIAVMFLAKQVADAIPGEASSKVAKAIRALCNVLSINLPQAKFKFNKTAGKKVLMLLALPMLLAGCNSLKGFGKDFAEASCDRKVAATVKTIDGQNGLYAQLLAATQSGQIDIETSREIHGWLGEAEKYLRDADRFCEQDNSQWRVVFGKAQQLISKAKEAL